MADRKTKRRTAGRTEPDKPTTAEKVKRLLLPTRQRELFMWAIGVWILSFLWIGFYARGDGFAQALILGGSIGTVAFLTFAAFFVEVGTDGMRTALAAAFVVFFLALTSHMIAAPNLRNALDTPTPPQVQVSPAPVGSPAPGATAAPAVAVAAAPPVAFGREIYNNITDFVKLILAFYFGAVTAERLFSKGKVEGETDGEDPANPPPSDGGENAGAGANAGAGNGGAVASEVTGSALVDPDKPQTEPV